MSRKPPKHAKRASPNVVKTNTPNATVSKTSSTPATIVSKPVPVVPMPTVSAQAKPAPAKVIAKVAARPSTNSKPKVIAKKDAKKDVKKVKPEKIKMERDSFTMPKEEYAQITMMKARLTALGQPAKKSELLRAGIKLLAAMSDNTLKTTLAKIPVIKTGRPNKKVEFGLKKLAC